jgi:hypothetical protein
VIPDPKASKALKAIRAIRVILVQRGHKARKVFKALLVTQVALARLALPDPKAQLDLRDLRGQPELLIIASLTAELPSYGKIDISWLTNFLQTSVTEP